MSWDLVRKTMEKIPLDEIKKEISISEMSESEKQMLIKQQDDRLKKSTRPGVEQV